MQKTTWLYHISSLAQWQLHRGDGTYVPETFHEEGFIHCSYLEQLTAVANRRFRHRQDLVILRIARAALSAEVIEENLEGGAELYPHLYGALPHEAVAEVVSFPCDALGWFRLPAGLTA